MAHYAKLDKNNLVVYVTAGRDEDDENVLSERTGDVYKKTSYNTYGGNHFLGGTPLRMNFASIGFKYDEDLDAFIPPQPSEDHILNLDTCLWELSEEI
jgi:hypothetical protein